LTTFDVVWGSSRWKWLIGFGCCVIWSG